MAREPNPFQTEFNYHQGAETEEAGARKASEGAGSVRAWIVKTLYKQSMTDEEIGFEYQRQFGKSAGDFFTIGNTLRRRRHELKKAGIVEDTGERRRSRAKLKNIVWGLCRGAVNSVAGKGENDVNF